MLKIFSKKKMIQTEDYAFLRAVVIRLPEKYSYLKEQVSTDFILDKEPNELGEKGTFTLTLNAELEAKYSNSSFPNLFIIKDIGVWNKRKESNEFIELHILEGMLAGFRVIAKYSDLDINKIDISHIKEKQFKNEDKEALKNIIGKVDSEILSIINIESTFKIEIPEGEFYTIKELGDGNYLGMNKNGVVYGLIHDPYEVEKIYDNKNDFFKDLKMKKFKISE